MKKIRIQKSQLELLQVDLVAPQILIGRSPACDAVFRAPGVLPIHYLLEWVGEGEFDPDLGFWTLYDLSLNQLTEKLTDQLTLQAAGAGIVLGSTPLISSGFQFTIIQDRLSETHLAHGTLGQAFKDKYELLENTQSSQVLLELVRFKKEDGSLVDIVHHGFDQKKNQPVRRMPEIKINWTDTSRLDLIIKEKGFVAATSLKDNQSVSQSGLVPQLPLLRGEIFKLEFSEYEIYARFVAKIKVSPISLEFFKDRFILFSLGTMVFFAVFLWVVSKMPDEAKIEQKPEAQRIVTIKEDVAALEPPAPPAPPPPPLPKEKEIPEPKPTPKPPQVEKLKLKPAEKAKNSVAAAPTFKTQKGPPKTGLNAPAPVANVNTVGLLGKFKKKPSGQSGAAPTISAEEISQTFADDAAVGSEGRVVVNSAKTGVVDLTQSTTGATAGEANLAAASTTLQGNGDFNPENAGSLANEKGLKGKYTLGLGAGKEATSKTSLGEGKVGNAGAESITGGLTREEVRKAIAEQRRAIRTCFESALSVRHDLKGTMVFKWTISPAGSVTTIKVSSSELKSDLAEGCVLEIIRQITFPKAKNGQPTEVIYPFMFQKS